MSLSLVTFASTQPPTSISVEGEASAVPASRPSGSKPAANLTTPFSPFRDVPGFDTVFAPWLVKASAAGSAPGVSWPKAPSPAASVSSTSGSSDFSFLSDASLSIEDKLSRFMIAVQQKIDDEIATKMEDYKAKYGDSGSASKSSGGGIFGFITSLFPAGSVVDSVLGGLGDLLGGALESFGGPLLGALATAVGLPMLAPVATKVGKEIGAAVGGAISGKKSTSSSSAKASTPKATTTQASTAKGSTTKSSTTSKTTSSSGSKSTGEAGSPDERLAMLEIQRLVEKQNQMFTLVSNLMKSMHETAMTAVQNVR